MHPCFEARLLHAALGVEKDFVVQNTKRLKQYQRLLQVRVDIDGCGAGDKTTGVLRSAELGVKWVVEHCHPTSEYSTAIKILQYNTIY